MNKTLQNRIVKKLIFAKKGYPIPRSQNDDDDLLEEEIEINEDYVSYLEHALKNGIEGFSCLYTTTDNYGKLYKCSGNQTFKANPKKFGFTKVQNNEVQPGDIVQVLRLNIPTHAIMFVKNSDSGLPLYNYSDGGKDETAIRKDKQFPLSESLTYTFTGLPSDSALWKKEYEEIYGHEKGGRLIPKHLTPSQPLVLQNDNTRVDQPIENIPITETNLYKQYLANPYRNTDFHTWKKRQELIQSSRKDEKVKADNKSSKVKEQETKQGEAIHNQRQRKEREAKVNRGIRTGIGLGGLALAQATPAAPYIDAVFATLGATGLAKQYDEGTLGLNLETGLHTLEMLPFGIRGVGKAIKYADDVAREAYIPYDFYRTIKETTPNIKGMPYNVGWGPKQIIKVVHATDSQNPLRLFFDKRFDVTTEGANPFGVWYLGKWGLPRTAATNSLPGKAEKAARARKLFENRKYKHLGEVTLEKPLTTVGDVPDRSALSYTAEKMGADGLIYNNVYDNGFDNNLVILSLKLHVPIDKKGSKIHIKKKNRGKFTASAKAHGMGVLEFASNVLNNKEDYSPTLIKRANFARNAKKFKHEEGSKIHKPFGHRSMLDNGWLSTKLLKNKKNVIPI